MPYKNRKVLPWKDALRHVIPTIIPKGFFLNSSDVGVPLVDGLMIRFTIRTKAGLVDITKAQMAAWGIDINTLYHCAYQNLRHSNQLDLQTKSLASGIKLAFTMDERDRNSSAYALLLPDLYAKIYKDLDATQSLYVMIPARDTLLVFAPRNAGDVETCEQITKKIQRDDSIPRPVSYDPIQLTPEGYAAATWQEIRNTLKGKSSLYSSVDEISNQDFDKALKAWCADAALPPTLDNGPA